MVEEPHSAQVGRRAPRFELPATDGRRLALDDYDGRWLLLFFYPQDFSLLCPLELTQLSARYAELQTAGAEAIGISTDSVARHEEWIAAPRDRGGLGGELAFPLASDETRETSRCYGVLLERLGVALRGMFLVDPNGVLQYAAVHSLSVGRSVDDILRVLAACQAGGMCPPSWRPGEAPIDLARRLKPGMMLDQFQIEDALGEGGMGSVYRATDLQLRRPVAIKVMAPEMLPSPEARTRFLREARVAAGLSHPNICAVHQVQNTDNGMYLVLQYIEGQDLAELLSDGPLPIEQATAIGARIADALAAVHAERLIHRDVKPRNIRIDRSGKPLLLDFGLSRPFEDDTAQSPSEVGPTLLQRITTRGMILGTLAYMSPEQARGGPVGPPSDVFSLGATLYESLTGISPFDTGETQQTMLRVQQHLPLPVHEVRAEIPPSLSALVDRAMEKEPAGRPSAAELRDGLDSL